MEKFNHDDNPIIRIIVWLILLPAVAQIPFSNSLQAESQPLTCQTWIETITEHHPELLAVKKEIDVQTALMKAQNSYSSGDLNFSIENFGGAAEFSRLNQSELTLSYQNILPVNLVFTLNQNKSQLEIQKLMIEYQRLKQSILLSLTTLLVEEQKIISLQTLIDQEKIYNDSLIDVQKKGVILGRYNSLDTLIFKQIRYEILMRSSELEAMNVNCQKQFQILSALNGLNIQHTNNLSLDSIPLLPELDSLKLLSANSFDHQLIEIDRKINLIELKIAAKERYAPPTFNLGWRYFNSERNYAWILEFCWSLPQFKQNNYYQQSKLRTSEKIALNQKNNTTNQEIELIQRYQEMASLSQQIAILENQILPNYFQIQRQTKELLLKGAIPIQTLYELQLSYIENKSRLIEKKSEYLATYFALYAQLGQLNSLEVILK